MGFIIIIKYHTRNILRKSKFNCEWVKSLSSKYNQPDFRNWTEKYITLKSFGVSKM